VPNHCDFCPVDAQNDHDGDGFCEAVDNCPSVANPDQADVDEDGVGNACEPDNDGDGVSDKSDNCPFNDNSDQADRDGDGDACDADSDNDGVLDASDQCQATPSGEVVDAGGCAIAEICKCGSPWKNKGAYVSCVAKTSGTFLQKGLITEVEKDALVSEAAKSQCGAAQK
jgi:hypothetical protein